MLALADLVLAHGAGPAAYDELIVGLAVAGTLVVVVAERRVRRTAAQVQDEQGQARSEPEPPQA